jgi:hypothetical protein
MAAGRLCADGIRVTTTIVHRLFEQALEREAAKQPPATPQPERAVVQRVRDSRWLRLLRAA